MLFDRLLTTYARQKAEQQFRFPEESKAEMRLPAPRADRCYLLYLHIPFCEALCPFCPFHRVLFEEDKARKYFAALRNEIRLMTRKGFRFAEIYVGGGTPTVLIDELARTIELLQKEHSVTCISVETNPAHLDWYRVHRLKEIGINRLSVGVQSFDDGILKSINRYQRYGSGEQIMEKLVSINGLFDTLNVDMIFNFPGQTIEQLKNDLNTITESVAVDQVSFYPLMVASATKRFLEYEMGGIGYDRERLLYKRISRHMAGYGYGRASSWCFSRKPGMIDEYITDNDQYLGLGSGAFSYLEGCFLSSTFSINRYLALIESGRSGLVRRRQMTLKEQMHYYLLMRLFGGRLDLTDAERVFSGRFERGMQKELFFLRVTGAITSNQEGIVLTESGQYLCVLLMREFFIGVNNFRDSMRQHIPRERSGAESAS